MDGLIADFHQNLEIVITPMLTNLCQCIVELTLILPLSVCRLGSNHQKGFLVGDELSDAAYDRENHDCH